MVRMIRPDGGECRVHESRVEEYRKLGHLVAEETGRDAPLSGSGAGTDPSSGTAGHLPSKGKAGKRKEATGHE